MAKNGREMIALIENYIAPLAYMRPLGLCRTCRRGFNGFNGSLSPSLSLSFFSRSLSLLFPLSLSISLSLSLSLSESHCPRLSYLS
jgi:hypothetical protein